MESTPSNRRLRLDLLLFAVAFIGVGFLALVSTATLDPISDEQYAQLMAQGLPDNLRDSYYGLFYGGLALVAAGLVCMVVAFLNWVKKLRVSQYFNFAMVIQGAICSLSGTL